jgi:hypothetical protein
MKSSVFRDIMPYILLKVNQRFGEARHSMSSDNPVSLMPAPFWFLIWINSLTLKMEATCSSEMSVDFSTDYMTLYTYTTRKDSVLTFHYSVSCEVRTQHFKRGWDGQYRSLTHEASIHITTDPRVSAVMNAYSFNLVPTRTCHWPCG